MLYALICVLLSVYLARLCIVPIWRKIQPNLRWPVKEANKQICLTRYKFNTFFAATL